jgi:hypothetical protein
MFLPHSHIPTHTYLATAIASSISGVTRPQMAAVISQAHRPWLLHLGHRERITTLESNSSLGYRRKEVYILREVVGCIMDLVVCAREQSEPGLSYGTTVNGARDQTIQVP